jgi:hypothetical protein
MVYEERDEMDLAEEDRLYESDPYSGADFSDTFREQLSDDAVAGEETISEEEAVGATGTVTSSDMGASDPAHDEFGETRESGTKLSEDEVDKEQLTEMPRDPYED